jgi:outer membrane protein assembly factor BamB
MDFIRFCPVYEIGAILSQKIHLQMFNNQKGVFLMNYRTKLITLVLLILGLSITIDADTTSTWMFKTGGQVYSSPAYFNGNIYIGSDDGNLYCLDAITGVEKWEFKTGGIIRCRPAISNGNVYFASDDGILYSLNSSSGIPNWCFDIGNNIQRILPNLNSSTGNIWDYFQSSPCIDSNTIYIGSADSCLYAIDTEGNLKWKAATKGLVRSTPCIYQNNVYVGSWDGYIYSLSKSNGSVNWKFSLRGTIVSTPCIADTILYCGDRDYTFYAINTVTGKSIWHFSYNQQWVESSATFANGFVYVGSSDDHDIYCFNAKTGVINWTCPVFGTTWSTPAYDNGTIYIGLASYSKSSMTAQQGGAMLALNAANGYINWRLNCGTSAFIGGVVSSPAVINNIVYYGSLDSNVYAVVNSPTSVENKQGSSSMPKEYQLANYPNPFNPTTNISYAIPEDGYISLKVYNVLGQELATVFHGFQISGDYTVSFNAAKLASGVYLYRLQAGQFSMTKKMMIIK